MPLNIGSKVKLNNGVEIPWFGLGVWQMSSWETVEAVGHALRTGYRHIDTATLYGNEREVGEAVRKSRISRDKVFVTTKLWNNDQGRDRAPRAFEESLKELDLGYVDLYLIHWPVKSLRQQSWDALLKLQDQGKYKALGVSNYTIRHLEELLDKSSVVPAVNQVEFHPFLYQKNLLQFCKKHGIQLEAYSPLTKGRRLKDPNLIEVAKKYKKSTAQILIRWCLQHEVVTIPKSSDKKRIEENASVFDFSISDKDMAFLDSLNMGFRSTWDPSDIP
jgi:diketogulonate reductase-like aldo/keto reductase